MTDLRAKAQSKFGSDFVAKADQIAKDLGFHTVFLFGIMDSESGMNPRINNAGTNPDGTVDYGLIQFNETYVLRPKFGITGAQFTALPAIRQLPYIHEFYKPMRGKVKRFGDLYGYNLAPAYATASNPPAWFVEFKKNVEQKFTAKTGLSPIASQIRHTTTTKSTKQDNTPLILTALLFLL